MIHTKGRRSLQFLVYIPLLVLLLPITNAVTDLDIFDYAILYHHFDNDSWIDDGPTQLWNATQAINVSLNTTGCKIGNCLYSNYTAFSPVTPRHGLYLGEQLLSPLGNSSFTICSWAHPDVTGSGAIFSLENRTLARHLDLKQITTTGFSFTLFNSTPPARTTSATPTGGIINQWKLLCAGKNSTHLWITTNATLGGSVANPPQSFPFPDNVSVASCLSATSCAFNGSIDELIFVNKSLNLDEIAYLYNNGLGRYLTNDLVVLNSLLNNTLHTNGILNGADTISGVINITSSTVGGNNLTAFNISVFVKPDFGPEPQCYGSAFQTLTGNQSYLLQSFSYNLSLNISQYPAGVYDILTCANDTISEGVDRRRFRVINATQTFDTPVQEETTHLFSLAFHTSGFNLNASVNLSYNNTIYQTSFSSDSTFFYANVSIQAPGLTSNSSVVPFYWNYTIFNVIGQQSGNIAQNNTNVLNQSVVASLIIPCNSTLVRTRNYTFLDEITFGSINSNLEILVTYRNLAGFERNFTDNRTAVPYYELCLNTQGANVIADVLLQYNTSGYTTRNWLTQSEVMNNRTINQSLYLLSSGLETPITFIVFDIDGNRLENVLVRANKLNISNNAYYITATEVTDSDGRAVLTIDITDAFYNFEFQQLGVTQLVTKNFKVQQSEYSIVLGMQVTSPLQQLIALRQVSSSITFNNNTNVFTLTWNDPNNVFDELFFVTQSNNGLFNFTQASNLSSSTLNQPVTPANVTYTSMAIVTIDGRNYTLAIEDVDLTQNWRRYGGTGGIIISLFIFLVCVFIGINRPRIAVFMGGVALVFIGLLGLMPLTYLLLSGLVFIIFIILLVMKERGGI